MRFSEWLVAAEAQLKRSYAINFLDAGFDDDFVIQAWRNDETPSEFVERIALKFDLEPVSRHLF
jgi:hypothetical protein